MLQASAAGDAEALGQVSESYPETLAGSWARVYQGNEFLGQGINALYNDRENAVQLLSDAKNSFSNALAGQSDPLLRSRAHFGLARVAESMGELEEAVKQYEETIAVGESDAMVEKAQQRIDNLASPSTQQFLTWFADQDFSPAEASLPPALPDSDMLPDGPDLELEPLQLEDSINIPGGEDSDVMENESGMDLPNDAQTNEVEMSDAETGDDVGDEAMEEASTEEASTEENTVEEVKQSVDQKLNELESETGEAVDGIQLDDASPASDPEPATDQ